MPMQPCPACGSLVVSLPMASRPDTWIPVEPQMFVTAQVTEASRWAWRRGQGLVSLDAVPSPPVRCLIVHGCAMGWVMRGGASPAQSAPRGPSADELRAAEVLARGRALGLTLSHPDRRADQHDGHPLQPHRRGTR